MVSICRFLVYMQRLTLLFCLFLIDLYFYLFICKFTELNSEFVVLFAVNRIKMSLLIMHLLAVQLNIFGYTLRVKYTTWVYLYLILASIIHLVPNNRKHFKKSLINKVYKMNKTLIAICLALTTTSISAIAADAGSGKITFKGVVNSGACTISPSDINKEVELGSISAASLSADGKVGPLNTFELKLQDCQLDPAATGSDYSKVKIAFNGLSDSSKATLWANAGSADNVAVAFFDNTGKAIKPGDTLEQGMKTPETTIILSAQAQATGVATAGTISSVANYVLSYE